MVPDAPNMQIQPQGGPGDGLIRRGQQMEAQGLQVEREQAQAAEQQARELKQQREAADRARASSVLANTRDRIADTAEIIDQEIQDGRLPKAEAGKAWRERTAEVLQASLGEVPEAHRGLVQQDLQGYVGRFDSRVANSVRKRDQADTKADLFSTLQALERSAGKDFEGSRAQAVAALQNFGPAAGMRPDEIARETNAFAERVSFTRATAALAGAKMDNGQLAKVEQWIQTDSGLDPQKQAQLLAQAANFRTANETRAMRLEARAAAQAEARDREAGRAWDVLSGWAMAGKVANPADSAALIAKLDPARAAAYRAMVADVGARTAVAMLPLAQQQAHLDRLIAQSVTGGTSQELEKEIARLQKAIPEARREYAADPLRAAASRGLIDQPAPLDMSSIDGMVGSVAQRVAQAQVAATRAGRAVSPLLPEEAARMGDLLGAVAPAAQGRMIAQLASVLPAGQMQALAAQINDKDRALSLQMAAGAAKTSEGRTVAELIGRGRQAIKDKAIKEESGAEFGLRPQLAKQVGEALTGKNREDVVDAARLIYLGKQAEGAGISVEGAVRLAVGGDIVEHNGRRVPVPMGIDLPQALRQVPARAIEAQAPDGYVYTPGARPMGVPEFLAGLPEAQLEAVAPGRYVVRSGGGLVMNKDRRPVVVKVQP
jgi:hypothetical protein